MSDDTDNDIMTKAQREAICKAYSMLGEQFDKVLIVIDFEVNNPDTGDIEEAHEGFWKGGALTALGMCEFARDRILRSGRKSGNEP